MPSFEQLRQAYPGRIAAAKKNIRPLHQVNLCHTLTGRMVAPPTALAESYSLVIDGEMVVLPKSGPFWGKDRLFMSRVRTGLGRLRFARMDIFDTPEYFKGGSLDLIYMSDIFWPEPLAYYQTKLARMAGLLRPGGRIIAYLDAGDDFMGRGVSPGRLLAQEARLLALKVDINQSGYLVLERVRKKR